MTEQSTSPEPAEAFHTPDKRLRKESKITERTGPARQLETPTVSAWQELVKLPTYLPAAPDRNPMFIEKRVYQGSSGKVYPLPFTDRICEKPVDHQWKAVWIENEFLRVMVLPEIGGRIHAIQDKTNGYDLIYKQPVIKPALVGLAGPWASGGIEFNWPQHHRPATFLPVDFEIESLPDGSKTIWCGDHDPMFRMKGMHGVCLHPGKAFVELKVRVYNRTPGVQTFLWWANVATKVHEAYQSFFPPDVYFVADHARRSTTDYPLAKSFYYGVDYKARGRKGVPPNEAPAQFIPPALKSQVSNSKSLSTHLCRDETCPPQERSPKGRELRDCPAYEPNDLSFYANIPVPTSYMCMGSKEDFFGGYDYSAEAGIIHVANHHISPGKKQWTWGNHEFGYAWDRNLTDRDAHGEYAPYIEIMAGVYTDNQPDFSFLQPGETKSWSQFWYPIQKIGPAQHANIDAALSLQVDRQGRKARLGVVVTMAHPYSEVTLERNVPRSNQSGGTARSFQKLAQFKCDLAPGLPFLREIDLPSGTKETDLRLRVTVSQGRDLISYAPIIRPRREVPPPADEPPAPQAIGSSDELYLTGLHLDQYRHATRCPSLYWREALRRDPGDSRCNNAMGLWHFKRGEFGQAEKFFRAAIKRLTRRNANPYDGEAYYNLGLCLRHQVETSLNGLHNKGIEEAYAAFYKATWNQAWASAGYHCLAEIDCVRSNWPCALDHLNRSLRFETDNLRARNLKVMVLRNLGQEEEAGSFLRETRAMDKLDWWSRYLSGEKAGCDLQVCLDLAHDFTRAGFCAEAIELLEACAGVNEPGHEYKRTVLPTQNWGALPLVYYTLGWLEQMRGNERTAMARWQQAASASPDYCFPARLEEIAILEAAMRANPNDARAPYYLGNLLYDRRRHSEAIKLWERSAKLAPGFSVVWRNLGIGYFNHNRPATKARAAYERAFLANPADARLLYERDQLWKRLGESPSKRLRELELYLKLVHQRDDLTIELCALYNQTGRHDQALALVNSRNFQPWEGGEGGPLGQHVRSHMALGRKALVDGDPHRAKSHFESALSAPLNLGEAKHLLANQSDIHYWLGCTLAELGEKALARKHWTAAAEFRGDFQEMSVRAFSEMTYYSALAMTRLGRMKTARKVLSDLLAYAKKLQKTEAKIDFFATSLPTMLLFDDDLQFRQETTALLLQAQAHLGLGRKATAAALLKQVLSRDPNHAIARDLQAETIEGKS